MAVDYAKLLAKLDRPPAGPNWVRFVQDSVPKTTKSILAFVRGTPPFTYGSGYTAIKDRLHLGISLETALKITTRSGAPAGREQNKALVSAFFEHDGNRTFPCGNTIEFEREFFRVSREVSVPVSPLSVIRENGKFVPLFVCGWSELKLTEYQRRLLVTICEDAFLSLTDFQNSPAEYLFFPKQEGGEGAERTSEIWQRGDYNLLSDEELNQSVEIFLQAREAARNILLHEMTEQTKREREGIVPPPPANVVDLFNYRKGR